MTVNITCYDCDGRRLCEACRTAARTLAAAGYRVEHSTRYAALRAAASGTYGFEACVVPVATHERAVIDAAASLLAGKRLAFVVDRNADVPADAALGAALLPRAQYVAGDFSLEWLHGTGGAAAANAAQAVRTSPTTTPRTADQEADLPRSADQAHATRRLKRVADDARSVVARAGLPSAPRLDMFAVLEDEVAWAHASGHRFGIVLVHLHGVSAAKPGAQPSSSESRTREAEILVSRAVRSTDVVSGRGDDFLIVLPEADGAGTALAMQRVTAALNASDLRVAAKPKRARGFAAWSVGRALYPDDGTTRDGLLARATASLQPLG